MENIAPSQVDLRQSPEYANYIRTLGWKVERIDNTNIFIRPLGIFGAIAKIQRFDKLNFEKLEIILKRYRVWMTKAEPNIQYSMLNNQFRQDNWPLLASKTLRVDLNNIRPRKDARYCLRKAQNAKREIRKNNFGEFYKLWKRAAEIKRLWIPAEKDYWSLIKAFGKKAFCVTIDDSAGAVVLTHDKIAYYYYAAALPEAKKNYLPYSSVWELMKEAKKRECKIWDWEGIYDERWPNKGWRGFTHFKKSFGGYEVEFPGSFTRWF